jgi:hypothetical protein
MANREARETLTSLARLTGELNERTRANVLIAEREPGLHVDCTLDRIDHAGKLGEDAVARRVYEASVVLFDETVDDLAVR